MKIEHKKIFCGPSEILKKSPPPSSPLLQTECTVSKWSKLLHLFYNIYIFTCMEEVKYILTCTEEATEMAAKYLQNKICF